MDADEIGFGDHLAIIGAAPAHPAVGHADDRKPARLGLGDRGARGVIHRQHADIVAAVVQRRDLGLAHDADRAARALEAPVLGDVQDFRQPRILVAAQAPRRSCGRRGCGLLRRHSRCRATLVRNVRAPRRRSDGCGRTPFSLLRFCAFASAFARRISSARRERRLCRRCGGRAVRGRSSPDRASCSRPARASASRRRRATPAARDRAQTVLRPRR